MNRVKSSYKPKKFENKKYSNEELVSWEKILKEYPEDSIEKKKYMELIGRLKNNNEK